MLEGNVNNAKTIEVINTFSSSIAMARKGILGFDRKVLYFIVIDLRSAIK